MPLFSLKKEELRTVDQTNFSSEKGLQKLIENNIRTVFGCRRVASEFPTGAQHGGRIDTLALSEEDNPVIIEYKKVESSDLINQSLFYLSWIHDHRGDFEIAVQKAFGSKINVDWSDVRVICIAPNYRKYDLHAVQVMRANLELWTYRLFKNGSLYLEEVLQKTYAPPGSGDLGGKWLTAGQKAALTRKTRTYTFEQHLKNKPANIRDLALVIQEFVLAIDPAIEEVPKKFYVAYKISQNIVCMEIQRQKILLFLKLDPKTAEFPKGLGRDVSKIGHYGTGDLELLMKTRTDFDSAKDLIVKAYQKLGG